MQMDARWAVHVPGVAHFCEELTCFDGVAFLDPGVDLAQVSVAVLVPQGVGDDHVVTPTVSPRIRPIHGGDGSSNKSRNPWHGRVSDVVAAMYGSAGDGVHRGVRPLRDDTEGLLPFLE